MSIVLELQKELYNDKISAEEALRKAYVISKKLSIDNMSEWIDEELNGYQDITKIPAYRNIIGTIEAFNPYHGWYPVIFQNSNNEEQFDNVNLDFSISEIEAIIRDNKDIVCLYTSGTAYLVNKVNTKVRFQTSVHKFIGITSRVKNIILEWTLQLEENDILGEDFSFTQEEKEKSKELSNPIYNIIGDNNIINSSDLKQNINKKK